MFLVFFFNGTSTTEIYTLSLHDALPILYDDVVNSDSPDVPALRAMLIVAIERRSEEHTSELQSRRDLVCRLLLEKKKSFFTYPTMCEYLSLVSGARDTCFPTKSRMWCFW